MDYVLCRDSTQLQQPTQHGADRVWPDANRTLTQIIEWVSGDMVPVCRHRGSQGHSAKVLFRGVNRLLRPIRTRTDRGILLGVKIVFKRNMASRGSGGVEVDDYLYTRCLVHAFLMYLLT